jgi:hypothetical protein
MLYRAALFLVPLAAFAQTPAPEVEEALRARVTEFFNYHVDGNFRKAYDLVAEDTKDQYFGAQKIQYKSFKIDSVKFSDNFTKADVALTGERSWRMSSQLPETKVTVPMNTSWKLEGGKWMYHEEPRQLLIPMGPSAIGANAPASKPSSDGQKLPNVSPEAIAAAARNILQQSSVDKSEVLLSTDKASTDQVVFHNGFQGGVKVALESMPNVAGLHAEVEKADVNAGQNTMVKIRYEPAGKIPDAPVVLRLLVEPFHQVFTITVKFAPPKS